MTDENKIFKKSDKLSKEHGFTRAFEKPVGRRRRTKEATRALNVQLPESEFERFVKIADQLNLTYWETIVQLMNKFEDEEGAS